MMNKSESKIVKTYPFLKKLLFTALFFTAIFVGGLVFNNKKVEAATNDSGWGWAMPVARLGTNPCNNIAPGSAMVVINVVDANNSSGVNANIYINYAGKTDATAKTTFGNTISLDCVDVNKGVWLGVWGASGYRAWDSPTPFRPATGSQQFNWCCGFNFLDKSSDAGHVVVYYVYLERNTDSPATIKSIDSFTTGTAGTPGVSTTTAVNFTIGTGPQCPCDGYTASPVISVYLWVNDLTTGSLVINGNYATTTGFSSQWTKSVNLSDGHTYQWYAQTLEQWRNEPSMATLPVSAQIPWQYFKVQTGGYPTTYPYPSPPAGGGISLSGNSDCVAPPGPPTVHLSWTLVSGYDQYDIYENGKKVISLGGGTSSRNIGLTGQDGLTNSWYIHGFKTITNTPPAQNSNTISITNANCIGTLVVHVFDDSGNANGTKDLGESDVTCPTGSCSFLATIDGPILDSDFTRSDINYLVYGDSKVTTGNHAVYLQPDASNWAVTKYSYQTATGVLITNNSYTGPVSSWYNTVGIPIEIGKTTTVYLGVKKTSDATLKVSVFDDGAGCGGDGLQNCGELPVTSAVLAGLKVRVDSDPTIATNNPNSFGVSSGSAHTLFISPFVESAGAAWVVTQWNIGNSVGSNTPYTGSPPNFSATVAASNFTVGGTTNVYLGVRRITLTITANPPKALLNPAGGNAPPCDFTNSSCEIIPVILTWSPGWDESTTYQVSSSCADINSDSNEFHGQISPPSGKECTDKTGVTITALVKKPACPNPPNPCSSVTSVDIEVFTTTTGVGGLPSTTFSILGNSVSTVQGITLSPTVPVIISFGYAAWLKTILGDVGSLNAIGMGIAAPSGQYNAEKLVISTLGSVNFSSTKNWLIKNTPLTLPAPNNFKSFSDRFPDTCSVSGSQLTASKGRFKYSTNVTWDSLGSSAFTCPASGVVNSVRDASVIFINGDFDIKTNLAPVLPTVIVVSKNINIHRCVTTISNVVLIADGSFSDSQILSGSTPQNCAPLPALTINGSVIGALGNSGVLNFNRNLSSALNQTTPAETLNLQPRFFWALADYIGKTSSRLIEQTP